MSYHASDWRVLKLPGGQRQLRVLVLGDLSCSGPAVVYHGMGARPELDQPLHDELIRRGHAVVAPELPNHGHSSNAHTFREVMAMVTDGLGLLGVKDGHYIGHSFGGAVVYGMADYPEFLTPDRLAIAANSPLGPRYHNLSVADLVIPLGLVATDLVVSAQVAAFHAALSGRLLQFNWSLARALLLPPPRLQNMLGVLTDASVVLADAPHKLHAAGLRLIRYWGELDLGIVQSAGAVLPGEDRTLAGQPHCTNFFSVAASCIGNDLATAT